ncbi:hypothetical protein KSP39_PZI002189 [Platanthera zijinensis]|uniref:Thioesterase domain-containing protein n=1 Tax=Platanthera zijinensis TaxID=2320716 RepID=A0AAP0BZZ9_9ASPA
MEAGKLVFTHGGCFPTRSQAPFTLTGHLHFTNSCCQKPFKMLHRGVSLLIAEEVSSMGAHVASGFKRVAGIEISINRHRSATVGDLVYGHAEPLEAANPIQLHLGRVERALQGAQLSHLGLAPRGLDELTQSCLDELPPRGTSEMTPLHLGREERALQGAQLSHLVWEGKCSSNLPSVWWDLHARAEGLFIAS